MFKNSTFLLITACLLLLSGLSYSGYRVHTLSLVQQRIRMDYASANNITFGLLSVSRWRDQLQTVITDEIQNFDLTSDQKQKMQVEIETILNSLIDKVVASIEAKQRSVKGKLTKLAFNIFVSPKSLHERVPEYARSIIAEIEKPASKKRLRSVALSKIEQMGQETYDSSRDQQLMVINTIYKKYHVTDENDFNQRTDNLLAETQYKSKIFVAAMFGFIVGFLILWLIIRKRRDLHKVLFMLSVAAALVVLITGLTSPMIEVDARIQSLNFYLLGTHIKFNNQVLFFQSKSIFDVVRILMKAHRYDSIIVGSLLLCFSILFPVAKLVSASIYVLDKPWCKNKLLHFFAFKSGKWSMADVVVIGIMMTYLGFNAILESQLEDLNIKNESLVSITTNNTSLQPGFIVFVGFVVFGLILSQILKNITGLKQE